jgi:flagellar motor switch protein FliG
MNEETKKLKKINHVLKSLIKEGNIKSLRLLDDEEFYSVVAEVTYPYSINPEIVENIIENFLEKVNNEWIRIDFY